MRKGKISQPIGKTKLHPRGDGPFQILEKINDNAYKVDLPGEYKVSATFNVSDLSPFDVGEDSWSNPFEERGNDGNQGGPSLKDPLQVPDGPITRSRAKKIKEAMQGLVQSTWDEASKSPTIKVDGKKKAEFVKMIHEKARLNIERRIKKYVQQANKGRKKVVFEPGDWVWLHLRKDRFLEKRRSKLLPRGDGPFQVVERINNNAYKLDLPGEYGVSASFNVADLSPFDVGDDLRTNPSQEGENDANQGAGHVDHTLGNGAEFAQDLLSLPSGPITRLRAKRFKEALNGLIQENWADSKKTKMGSNNNQRLSPPHQSN
uniref:Tf2-1-like SH3-like domain-containing protein n=1 Tax=Fagus sylvatica TaxID=28930 RepID=A0A2N9FAV0_FAGSY